MGEAAAYLYQTGWEKKKKRGVMVPVIHIDGVEYDTPCGVYPLTRALGARSGTTPSASTS